MKANRSNEKGYARSGVAVTAPRGSLEDLSRKRKQEHSARLSELDRLSQLIQQGKAMTTDDRQRKMSVIYSRRKRVRQKQRVDNLTETCVTYRENNQRLRRENQCLESLLLGATQLIQRVESSRGEGSIHQAGIFSFQSEEAQLPLELGHSSTMGPLPAPASWLHFPHAHSSNYPWTAAYQCPVSLELALMQQPLGVDFRLPRNDIFRPTGPPLSFESNGIKSQLSYQPGFLDRFRQSMKNFSKSASTVTQAKSTVSCNRKRLKDTLMVRFPQVSRPTASTTNPTGISSQKPGQHTSQTLALLERIRQLQN